MTRYIDADALMEKYERWLEETPYTNQTDVQLGKRIVLCDIYHDLKYAPTIETICGISIDDAVLLLTKYLNGELVEVVRCKECRKQGSDDCPMFNREWRTIMRGNKCVDDFIFHDLTEPNGFCSYGERNNNE